MTWTWFSSVLLDLNLKSQGHLEISSQTWKTKVQLEKKKKLKFKPSQKIKSQVQTWNFKLKNRTSSTTQVRLENYYIKCSSSSLYT